VARAAAGVSRGEADVMVRRLIDLYKPDLDKRPKGQPFGEVYDVVTVKPRPAWLETYEEVKGELRQMGLPLA
jgi:hypothetical protein